MMPLQQRAGGQLRTNNGGMLPGNVWGGPPGLVFRGDRQVLQPFPDGDDNQPANENRHADDEEAENAEESGGGKTFCCLPSGCPRVKDSISSEDPGDAVRVICNNEACSVGRWMHAECFQEWEEHVLSFLRSCGRARSWSEKQRLQNLWTKKGYDLAFKACDCKCGKGHLRKDLDYVPPPKKPNDRRAKRPKKMKSPGLPGKTPVGFSASGMNLLSEPNVRTPLRVRTSSLCSTGSSPPSSDGTPPLTPGMAMSRMNSGGAGGGARFEFFADAEQAAAGNIFWRRTNLSAFSLLPRHLQNPYQIKIEDEGPHGNDETRSFILTNLSAQKVTVVHCSVCQMNLPVYDKYPLIDGTFFLSPHRYSRSSVTITLDRRRLFLNCVCMRCLDGTNVTLQCIGCKTPWSGTTFIIGTMYSYDVFAAIPCCAIRLTCTSCRQTIHNPAGSYQFFSEYSRLIRCPGCGVEDYHFVKPLQTIFSLKPGRGAAGSRRF